MSVIFLAHARTVECKPPDNVAYTRYKPDLHKTSSAMIQEWCDEVLFAAYTKTIRQEDLGFNKKHSIVIGGGERTVFTCEKPTHLAKRRVWMPDEIPMKFDIYVGHVRAARSGIDANGNVISSTPPAVSDVANAAAVTTSPANITGLVVDGSSKQPDVMMQALESVS